MLDPRAIASLALALLLAACGGGTSGSDGGGDDAGDVPDGDVPDGDLSNDAEVPDAEAPDAEPPDAEVADASGSVTTYGTVIVSEFLNVTGADSNVEAVFKDEPLFGIPIATGGGCALYDGNSTTVGSSAGVVAITGTTVPVTMTPSGSPPDVAYNSTPDPTPTDLYAPGATINATAPGGAGFPAFSISADGPGAIAGFTPPSTFSRSAPPALTWTAGTADTVLMELVTIDATFSVINVVLCYTPDDGAFDMPAAAMALVPASQTQAAVALVRINQATINPSGTTQLDLLVAAGQGGDLGTLGP